MQLISLKGTLLTFHRIEKYGLKATLGVPIDFIGTPKCMDLGRDQGRLAGATTHPATLIPMPT